MSPTNDANGLRSAPPKGTGSATFDRELLDAMVRDGWLRSQRHPDADLWIYNYTEKTQYENHWTPETLVCRGLILDELGRVVARPFAKFFNYGTSQAASVPAEPFVVTEKVDGSLGILYQLGGAPHIATRGSFTSEQAKEGTAMIRERWIEPVEGTTPLFEIVYPGNRIVVDYGSRRDLILLDAVDNATGRNAPHPQYPGPVVQHYGQVDIDTLAEKAAPNREGFVVTFESGLRVKVKFAEYVRLHKIVTGVNARMVWEAMRQGDGLEDLLAGIPDEIHEWIVATPGSIQAAFEAQAADARRVFDARPETDDRKTLAAYFLGSGANAAVLFRMLDDKPVDDLIWKAIRPGPLTPSTLRSMEIAP